MMDKTKADLFELGRAFEALPDNAHGHCEPTSMGFKIGVDMLVDGQKLSVRRLLSWEMWHYSSDKVNPLVALLEIMMEEARNAGKTGSRAGTGEQ